MPSQGPLSPTSAVNASYVGQRAWSNPTNIYTSNNARATASLTQSVTNTQELRGRTFGFSIPTNATITGVVVEIERLASEASMVRDLSIRLYNGSTSSASELICVDRATTAAWPKTEAFATYGGATDLWDVALTPNIVNSATFGVALRAQIIGTTTVTASVDFLRMTIHYVIGAPRAYSMIIA